MQSTMHTHYARNNSSEAMLIMGFEAVVSRFYELKAAEPGRLAKILAEGIAAVERRRQHRNNLLRGFFSVAALGISFAPAIYADVVAGFITNPLAAWLWSA